MKLPVKKLFLLFALGALLSGCVSPSQFYPGYEDQARRFETIAVLTDFTFLRDSPDGIRLIDLPENRKAGETLARAFSESFTGKGYRVSQTIQSVGRLAKSGMSFRVREETNAGLPPESLPLRKPPFFSDGSLGQEAEPRLAALFSTALRHGKRKGAANLSVPEAVQIGQQTQTDALLVIAALAHKPSTGKQVAYALFGVPGVGALPTIMVHANLIDARTGELIWANHWSDAGSGKNLVKPQRLARAAERIMKEFPNR